MRPMRISLFILVLTLASVAQSQTLPDCASLLTTDEVRSLCEITEVTVQATRNASGDCSATVQREDTASLLTMAATVQESREAAQLSVQMAGAVGEAGDGLSVEGEGNAAISQVAGMLGLQDADAPEAEDVSDEEAAFRTLPDLGDGGVRYVTDTSGAMGVATHTVMFSSGAVLVKLESGIVAGRAGICTADGLERLARRVAGRL